MQQEERNAVLPQTCLKAGIDKESTELQARRLKFSSCPHPLLGTRGRSSNSFGLTFFLSKARRFDYMISGVPSNAPSWVSVCPPLPCPYREGNTIT